MKHGCVIYSVTKTNYTHLILLTPVNVIQIYIYMGPGMIVAMKITDNFVNSTYKFGLQYKGYPVL